MKLNLLAMILAAGSLMSAPAMAEDLDFALVNETGYTINEIHVSPATSNDWEEDVMGSDVLEDGDGVNIRFPKGAKGCDWDLKVTYDDGEEAMWGGADLCSISKIVLYYDRSSGKTWAESQ